MGQVVDISGQRFGFGTVGRYAGTQVGRQAAPPGRRRNAANAVSPHPCVIRAGCTTQRRNGRVYSELHDET